MTTKQNKRYTLYYFETRGRAEPIRLMLSHLGLPFEDKALDRDAWLALKPTSPLGQMPILVEHADGGDVMIPQSMAILRHLAREHDFYGKTEAARLQADIAADTALDLRNAFSSVRFSPAWKDEAAKSKYIKESAPPHFQRLAKLLGSQAFVAGDAPTFADFVVCDSLDTHAGIFSGCLADFPTLTQYVARVRALPSLQPYLKVQRPAA